MTCGYTNPLGFLCCWGLVYAGIILIFFTFSSLLVLEAGEDTECIQQSA